MSDWDVTLDGVDYMLVPGSYRAFSEPAGDGRAERQRLAGFAAGLNLPRPVDGGGLLAGLRAWPAPWPLGAAGVGPAPARQAVSGTIDAGDPKLTASDRTYTWIVAGSTVYRWDRLIAGAPVSRATLPAAATSLVRLRNTLYIAHGAGADVSLYDDVAGSVTASALGAGVQATLLATFSRGIVLVAPGFPTTLHIYYGNSLTYQRSWALDGVILGLAQIGDRMIVATDAGLHVLSGQWYQDTDPPAPPETLRLTSWGTLSGQLQDRDDFSWLIVYQGRLFTWLGKRVVRLDEPRETWEPSGLAGGSTSGAAVVNGWLLVSLSPRSAPATYQLWGYNGSGWWLLDEASGTNPFSALAADGAGRLLAFTAGSGAIAAWDLDDTSALASPFSLTTPLLDGGMPARQKHWRQAGIELARTDGQPVGDWSVAVEYSADHGGTWASAGAAVAVTSQSASLRYPLDVESPELLLRVTLTRATGNPPFVTSIWADYDNAASRRRWQFRVHARSKAISRTGALDSRTAEEIRAALWSTWENGGTVSFRDVDVADTDPQRTVRLLSIREERPQPATISDPGGFSVIEVTLAEH